MSNQPITIDDLEAGLQSLDIDVVTPVLFHTSFKSFGPIEGGIDTLVIALTGMFNAWMTPAFTYKTMIIPECGPEHNGITYGSGKDLNRMAEFFSPDMEVDKTIGITAELLRKSPQVMRSSHPILSFCGFGVEEGLEAQTLNEPLAPIKWLYENEGCVILLGVDHTSNTSIHYAEKLAGRKQFLRWALTPDGILPCPGFPGCSQGFNQEQPLLASFSRQVSIGQAQVTAIPVRMMIDTIANHIRQSPGALLCENSTCERCREIG